MSARDVIAGCLWHYSAIPSADAILAALHAAGYMIVPREATTEMVLAAIARPDDGAPEEGLFYHAIYRAMTGAGELK